MRKVTLEEVDPFPELVPPPEGWHEVTCDFDTHNWTLEIEEGRATVRCIDPCDPDKFAPGGAWPCCFDLWEPEDFHTPEPIPVVITYVNDSTPSTPMGPAEYGYYLEIRGRPARWSE